MPGVWNWLLDVRCAQEDVRRRGQTLVVVSVALIGLSLVMAPVAAVAYPAQLAATVLAVIAAIAAVYVLIIAMARRGRVDAAIYVLSGSYAAALLTWVWRLGRLGIVPIFCCLIVTLAGTLLPPRRVLISFLLALGLMPVLALLANFPTGTGGDGVLVSEVFFAAAAVCSFTAAVTTVNAVVLQRALSRAREQSGRASTLAVELADANAELEDRVRQRTSELADLLKVQIRQATQLADALAAQEQLAVQLHELSVRDELTGLHNRRHLDRLLGQLFTRARQTGRPLSVAILDIDDFKRINDDLSHGVGDEVLRRIAKVLAAATRPVDVVARYGGEEFALLLPDADLREADAVCERVRAAVARADLNDLHPGLRVTISVGVAADAGFPTASRQVSAADRSLYDAKSLGKNQVRSYASPQVGLGVANAELA